ncbi:hypothetical protein [Leptospira mtsangambouensis]|uniref:hypothetical protein n=1 Tax=Leptospira mtsangambouensis TaxID=2484912 RepID=UPI001EE9F8B2|nr:hypothetical protein [Leptospira mtsangambouensis]MCG6142736.1 hypothetical protein [Leptospira mtsangambouensis]
MDNKLLLNQNYNESTYLQSATELTVMFHFQNKFNSSFEYEPKLNSDSKKNPEFRVTEKEKYKFSVEAKCPDLKEWEEEERSEDIKISITGRQKYHKEDFENLKNLLESGFNGPEDERKNITKSKSMDNKLKDFVQSAHKKFPSFSNIDDFNVLFVNLGTPDTIERWLRYLRENEGIFTKNSFVPTETFNLIDGIVITNLMQRHTNEQNITGSAWDLNDAFCMFIPNPNCKIEKKSARTSFLESITSYEKEYTTYEVPGTAPEEVKINVKFGYFVREFLEENMKKFLF